MPQTDARLIDAPVRVFLDALAAQEPTPGGGSVAALSGALAAGLVSMVCRYTAGRDAYADVQDEVQRVLHRSDELRTELQQLVQDDVAAYGSYAAAQSLPRDTDEEVLLRQQAQQQALRESTSVPLDVAVRCAELLDLAVDAARIGNRYLISDAAVAARLADAGRSSALLNVEINVAGIEDAGAAEAFRVRASEVPDDAAAGGRVERAMATVRERTG